jgi:N-acetylglucosaminyldiphosphoundecaprenol N-acetyl-beta-D-mannosaminyltransferase
LADVIAAARPDLLFVAMTSPKKEVFLARWADRMGVPVCHGVGGAFDVLAGKVKRAPKGWQVFGFEWLYRVLQEPRRLWKRYLVTNLLFGKLVLGEFTRRMLGLPERQPAVQTVTR